MKSREEFQIELEKALGSEYVYYQPPEGLELYKGNRIVYFCDENSGQRADNSLYTETTKYTVTLITKNADWDLPKQMLKLFQFCRNDRNYKADGLYHHVFIIYY